MDQDIKELIELTTIIKIEEAASNIIIFGSEYYIDRFNKSHLMGFENDQHTQIELSELEQYWKKKWNLFNNSWNKEMQNYRFLYEAFIFFYFSFKQLHFNKTACINATVDKKSDLIDLNYLAGTNLYGIYQHGKKCLDLLKELNLLTDKRTTEFSSKFSETRNKLFEHNFNPNKLSVQLDLSTWSLIGTNSLLEIYVHKPDTERLFNAYIDYYEDYYRLEKIIVDIIKLF